MYILRIYECFYVFLLMYVDHPAVVFVRYPQSGKAKAYNKAMVSL